MSQHVAGDVRTMMSAVALPVLVAGLAIGRHRRLHRSLPPLQQVADVQQCVCWAAVWSLRAALTSACCRCRHCLRANRARLLQLSCAFLRTKLARLLL